MRYTLWQPVKTKIKCRTRRHFIRVFTCCKEKKTFPGQKQIVIYKILDCGPINNKMAYPNMFRKINQNEKVDLILMFLFRLYSDYIYFDSRHKLGPETFHQDVIDRVRAYRECFQQYSIRSCVYNPTMRTTVRLFNNVKGVANAKRHKASKYVL